MKSIFKSIWNFFFFTTTPEVSTTPAEFYARPVRILPSMEDLDRVAEEEKLRDATCRGTTGGPHDCTCTPKPAPKVRRREGEGKPVKKAKAAIRKRVTKGAKN